MKPNQINPQTVLSSLFTRWPQTIPFFNQRHLKCVGCSISSFDTLQDAAANYDLAIDELIGELQDAIDNVDGSDQTSH